MDDEGLCNLVFVFHLHTSRYSNIVSLHNPLTKVATKSWASIWHHMEQITENLSLHKQNMFFVDMESENIIVYSLNFRTGWQTIKNLRHEHLQA